MRPSSLRIVVVSLFLLSQSLVLIQSADAGPFRCRQTRRACCKTNKLSRIRRNATPCGFRNRCGTSCTRSVCANCQICSIKTVPCVCRQFPYVTLPWVQLYYAHQYSRECSDPNVCNETPLSVYQGGPIGLAPELCASCDSREYYCCCWCNGQSVCKRMYTDGRLSRRKTRFFNIYAGTDRDIKLNPRIRFIPDKEFTVKYIHPSTGQTRYAKVFVMIALHSAPNVINPRIAFGVEINGPIVQYTATSTTTHYDHKYIYESTVDIGSETIKCVIVGRD